MRVYAEVSECAADGLATKGGKNAVGGVYIGGGRFKICPKAVRERKSGVSGAREIVSSRSTRAR